MVESKALEINLASYQVDVTIDPKYSVLQEVMSKYYGLTEGLNTFLKELSHPYKNWQFIVREARVYSLDYFDLIKNHPNGENAARLFFDIFSHAIQSTTHLDVKSDAVDNYLLFLQKIIKDAGSDFKKFEPLINGAFQEIRNFEDRYFFFFVKSYYQIKRLAEFLLDYSSGTISNFESINLLLIKYFQHTYAYWLKEIDPQFWFEEEAGEIPDKKILQEIFNDISHKRIKQWDVQLTQLAQGKNITSRDILNDLLSLPGYNKIVETYRELPKRLFDAGIKSGRENQWKVIFLFHIMNIAGLSMIYEESLRDINRTLSWLIANENHRNIEELIQKTFSILKKQTEIFPITALNCMLNVGKGVYKTDERDLINFFTDALIDLGFQTPRISGVGNDWQIKANKTHLMNIRTWLELIELNPKWSTRLLSPLIIYLSLCGVFIKDTDLFPRDITRLLNSPIEPVYNLVKQLFRLFPVFFNDIGAEGRLRDTSTKIDEINRRKDVLIHFLRKQSHVESSNQILDFMEATLNFWKTGKIDFVEPFVPPNIYSQIDSKGPYIDGVRKVMQHLQEMGLTTFEDFVNIHEQKLKNYLGEISDASETDIEKVELAIYFYKLLKQKYSINFIENDNYIAQLETEALPNLNKLKRALSESDVMKQLSMLLNYLESLKSLILSPQSYEINEDIYKKRHFTTDIPSMYGSYHELKFDALGLTFRIETLINVLFEELIQNFNFNLITKATFFQVHDLLILFDKALKLDGILSLEIERQLDLLSHSLEAKEFTFTQYLDIFKGFAKAVSNITTDYFNNIHEHNLSKILSQVSVDQLLPKYLSQEDFIDHERLKHRISEIFFRDRIALSLGLQQLDLFLSRILNTLFHQSDRLAKNKLHRLLNYDPERAMMSISEPKGRISGIIYLGNKGLNIVKLKSFDFPVPPGFIITTEAFRCREIIDSFEQAELNFKDQVHSYISALQRVTGKMFGDSKNPLLFSVRSGSSISQPGMMDTFLNVGIDEDIATGIAARTGNAWFGWDNYRRFLQSYGMSFGIERDDFDAIMGDFKQRLGILYKKGFTGNQMKKIALSYKKMIKDVGIDIVENPFDQLIVIISRVFRSWESSKTKTYRKIMGISDDWGTAVTVQAMVYGNSSQQSGAGVFFTHNPRWSGDTLRLWGDFTLQNQGEDVASGLVTTLPISITQQEIEMRDTDMTLETAFPEIYTELKTWANDLIYKKGWSPQEVEFTFESPSKNDLYLLQSRDMVMREREKVFTFDLKEKTDNNRLGHGIGASGGAMSGRAVFSLKEIDEWRTKEPDTSLILVRSDTVPDDIREIYAADALLTARGGVTSHAAVVAHQLGRTCVVGCGDLLCNEREKYCLFNDMIIKSGDHISIDGQEGSVYAGLLEVAEN
ncbi:MAG: PEP/pyruvate-binding domain-containing protein [Desulfobacterales bacterium]|jgi:pyruvate,orthophosphate dikinase|nr:pyruvate, phosphate dikinase [Desulfobacter sp.]MDP6394727.1 PEP/pyruvate-binding domain-containing protein [Desulfobacterales bacterium]MDP6681575.1 PEP/pyruvate-binding domain-containing protein [Desulfobacterales bacterium]MDP6806803.1 PEP/pyruvate-binding domain-containing protein [Desulfobacterales bacterium]|tara:strand:+ start:80187 stop:84365 length:4179 start_codon:yes stop_codon:yes gene_type:complete